MPKILLRETYAFEIKTMHPYFPHTYSNYNPKSRTFQNSNANISKLKNDQKEL